MLCLDWLGPTPCFEFRRDMSNQPAFLKGSNPVKDQNTLTAGLVFTFDSREGK